ncbi:MAG: pitrilysin family protein [Candidatus Nealsonbacteria bacterium]
MFKKTTLKNGLRIITVPQKSTQAVTVLALVGTGSKYETKEISGISHFLEHMFFKGTKKKPDKITIAETLDKVGGIYNAFTGEEYTGYFAKVAAGHFDLALDWVSDIYLHSLLPASEIAKEKGVIIEEINMIYDNPMAYVSTLWSKLLYGDQPAGWDILGTKESVSQIDREKLASYMSSQYVAQNTVVCVAGNVRETRAINEVKKYFAETKSAKPAGKEKVIERQTRPEVLLHFKETDQAHLYLGVRGYNVFHPQRYVQDILSVILGGMMSSRLFIEVRENLGLAYYIKTDSEANSDTGFLATRAGVDNKNVEKAIVTILREYRKISREKIAAGELKKAKDYIKGKTALVLEGSDDLASFYGAQELLEKKILTPSEIYAKIDKVSSRDVMKLAQDIFQSKNLNLAIVGPFKDKGLFEKILKL